MKKIINEENDCNLNVERDAVEVPAISVGREEMMLVLNG